MRITASTFGVSQLIVSLTFARNSAIARPVTKPFTIKSPYMHASVIDHFGLFSCFPHEKHTFLINTVGLPFKEAISEVSNLSN